VVKKENSYLLDGAREQALFLPERLLSSYVHLKNIHGARRLRKNVYAGYAEAVDF
jgi:hypothetical protein